MSFVVSGAVLAVVTALTCALPGTFLVLRHQAMLIDAMSHAVLPGIVIGAILSGTTHSPLMIFFASAMMAVVDGLVFLVVFVATKRLARFRGKQALRLLQKA